MHFRPQNGRKNIRSQEKEHNARKPTPPTKPTTLQPPVGVKESRGGDTACKGGGVLAHAGLVRRGSSAYFSMKDHVTHNTRRISDILKCMGWSKVKNLKVYSRECVKLISGAHMWCLVCEFVRGAEGNEHLMAEPEMALAALEPFAFLKLPLHFKPEII